ALGARFRSVELFPIGASYLRGRTSGIRGMPRFAPVEIHGLAVVPGCRHAPLDGAGAGLGDPAALDEATQQREVVEQRAGSQEVLTHALARRGAHRLGRAGVVEELPDRRAELLQHPGPIQEQAAAAMLDLVLDPADATRCDRAAL